MYKKIAITAAIILLFAANPLRAQIVIEMERQGNLFAIPCKVNGLPVKLLFDTGASGVSISLTEALFMYKNGYLSDDDIGGTVYSQIANGDIVENTEIHIHEIEIGGLKINNIKAMVSSTLDAPLLLGQSVIQQLGPIQLDGNKLVILSGTSPQMSNNAYGIWQHSYQENEAGNHTKAIEIAKYGLSLTYNSDIIAALYYEIGTAFHGIGILDSAIAAYRNSLKYKLSKETAYNLGVTLYEKQQLEEAYQAFRQCSEISDKDNEVNIMAGCYQYMAVIDYKLGRYGDAERYAYKSINLIPNSSAFFTLGKIMEYRELYSDAVRFYEQGVAFEPLRPSNINYYAKIGYYYTFGEGMANPNKAIDNYMKCIKCYEKLRGNMGLSNNIDAEFLHNAYLSASSLAYIYQTIKRYDLVVEFLEKALLINNGKFQAVPEYLMLCSAYYYLGQSTKAQEIIHQGLLVFPENGDIRFKYALLLSESDITSAIKEYKKILESEYSYTPILFDYATVYNNIAWGYHLIGLSSTGLPYSKKSVELNPNHDYSWSTLGEIYFVLERYQDCIDALNRCIALSDKYKKNSYELMGKSKIALGKKREGEKDLERARSILE